LARQYDQAIEQYRKALDLDPNFTAAHANLGMAYLAKSKYKEGIEEIEKGLTISPGNAVSLSVLGYAYAVAGRRAEALKVLDQLSELSKQKYVRPAFMARIYVGLGDKDKAFEWLEKDYAERGFPVTAEPALDPLRSDPRFQDLLRRMNLQP
jgi:tetratricopeptide (TPR) repeat protein